MAKTDTSESPLDLAKKKKKKAGLAAGAKLKAKKAQGGKTDKAGKRDKAGKTNKKARKSEGFEGLSKFIDHPLLADLLAAGAMAAVAAIAEHQRDDKKQGSSNMVKSVGKAAASAMGRKLMSDIGAFTTAATDAVKKA